MELTGKLQGAGPLGNAIEAVFGLHATAMGLFAAIPAVTAYNRYANHIDRVASAQETFVEEFSNILQRNINSPVQATASGH